MKISNASIKKLVKRNSRVVLSDSAVNAIAKILETKARSIAKYAVTRASKKGRRTVVKDDIYAYKMKFGD